MVVILILSRLDKVIFPLRVSQPRCHHIGLDITVTMPALAHLEFLRQWILLSGVDSYVSTMNAGAGGADVDAVDACRCGHWRGSRVGMRMNMHVLTAVVLLICLRCSKIFIDESSISLASRLLPHKS